MRFCVRVPVLSEQIKVTEPKVSTEGRRRTRAFSDTMRRAPSASNTVTTAGNASGIAATARLTAVRIISTGSSPRRTPTQNTRPQMAITARANRLPKAARRICKGVLRSPSRSSRPATLPSSVAMPVATTRPRPRPWVAVVPLNAMFNRSPSAWAIPVSVEACFSTVTDSPVRADSSILSWAISISRKSAGIWLPASSNTISPGTSVLAATTCGCPSRNTVAWVAASCWRAAMALSARQVCTKPIQALSSTITRMASVSTKSPITPEITAAAMSTTTMKSLN